MSIPRLLFEKIMSDIESRDLPKEKAAWELVSPHWQVTVSYSPELCMCANCIEWRQKTGDEG